MAFYILWLKMSFLTETVLQTILSASASHLQCHIFLIISYNFHIFHKLTKPFSYYVNIFELHCCLSITVKNC